MSRTFTKLIFAVTLLFGLLNSALADKYLATMEFGGGTVSGKTENVETEITLGNDGLYTIKFKGFNASISMLGKDIKNGTGSVTNLNGKESNGLTLTNSSSSQFEMSEDTKLDISKFSATIDADGKGEGSFTGTTSLGGFLPVSATCDFTLVKVVDNDTVVTKTLDFNDVPFYNKWIDLDKPNDTIKTNNDATAIGIKLYQENADFAMADFRLALGKDLSLDQRLLLEGLKYAIDDSTDDIHVTGKSFMHVDEYNIDLPAVVNIVVSKDNKIDGTIVITADIIKYRYEITVVFGEQAEGVVVETKILAYDYDKATKISVNSDKEFVMASSINFSADGVLIEKLQYSIVDQEMTLLITEFTQTAVDFEGGIESITLIKAEKAEAYINVNEKNVFLKNVDINLELSVIKEENAFGSLTIIDGGPATNKFIDMNAPFAIDGFVGRNISVAVDTTGNNLDGISADSEFEIGGVFDYADGEIKSVKLKDFDESYKTIVDAAKKELRSCKVTVVATDSAGNSSEIEVDCYLSTASVTIEEILPENLDNNFPIVAYADTATGKCSNTLASFEIKYVAKNEALGLTKTVATVAAAIEIEGKKDTLPVSIELSTGVHDIKYVWANPFTGETNEYATTITVKAKNNASVSNIASKTVSVSYKNGELIVNGANDANVSVINLSGATVYTGKAGAINLHKGIYIVKVDGKAYKVVVK